MQSASREGLQPLHIDLHFSHNPDKYDLVGYEATEDKQQIRTGSLLEASPLSSVKWDKESV